MYEERTPEEMLNELNRRREELTQKLEELQRQHEKGLISDEEYANESKKIQRELVEVMDRIVQMEFLSGYR
ncbi:MAG: hypothetical protein ACP5GO_06215 [Thermoprotei archaeon]|jgi:DNA-binding transcriptional MerR regulator